MNVSNSSGEGTYRSIHSYINWQTIPPVVVAGMLCLFAVSLTLTNTILKCCQLLCCKGTQFTPIAEDFTKGAVKLLFGDIFKEVSLDGKPVLTMYNRKVTYFMAQPFFVATILVFAGGFALFWTVFLIDESYACDPNLDCYPVLRKGFVLLPISNCSEFQLQANVTILCYQFVFEFAEGIGAMGGLVTVVVLSVKLVTAILFWFVNSPPNVKQFRGKLKVVSKYLYFMLLAFMPLIVI